MKYTGNTNLSTVPNILVQKPLDIRTDFINKADVEAYVDSNYSRWYSGMVIKLHDTGLEYTWWDVNALPSSYVGAEALLDTDFVYTAYPDVAYTDKSFNFFLKPINVTIDAGTVGLSNVDNTSDVNKPVSTATQTLLDEKAEINDAATNTTTVWSSDKTSEEITSVATASLDKSSYDPNEIGLDVYDVDNHVDGLIKKVYTATEQAKLAAIESAAQVNNINNTDATDLTNGGDSILHYHESDRNRANHTGSQLAETISDFSEAVAWHPADATADFELDSAFNNSVIRLSGTLTGITLPSAINGFIVLLYNDTGVSVSLTNTVPLGDATLLDETLSVLVGVINVGWVCKTL